MLVSRIIPNPSNAPVGTPGQLLRLLSSGIAEAMPNDSDGKVMLMASGSPAWGSLAVDLAVVATYKATARTKSVIANLLHATVTHDSVTLIEGDTLLVADTASPDGIIGVVGGYNGLYVVGAVSGGFAALARAPWYDTAARIGSSKVYVSRGSTHGGSTWKLEQQPSSITVDSTALTYLRDGASRLRLALGANATVDGTEGFAWKTIGSQRMDPTLYPTTTWYLAVEGTVSNGGVTADIRLYDATNSVEAAIVSINAVGPSDAGAMQTAGVTVPNSTTHYLLQIRVPASGLSADSFTLTAAYLAVTAS